MRLKGKLFTSSGIILAVSALGMGSSMAAAPAPIDVSTGHVTCDTITGTIKFPNALLIQGSPGITSNPATVQVAIDGCTSDVAGVSLAATKFKQTLSSSGWTHDSLCAPDGSPTNPVGTGSSSCHGTWAYGGKPDNADHLADKSGNFGSNSVSGIAGLSTTGGTVSVIWKSAAGTAKLFDNVNATPGTAASATTITDTFGSTFTDPFGIDRGEFLVGSPSGNGLSNESVAGAFHGTDAGHSSYFKGVLANSTNEITSYAFAKGLKTLTFAFGTIHNG